MLVAAKIITIVLTAFVHNLVAGLMVFMKLLIPKQFRPDYLIRIVK
jgi:hypothetical protein